MFLMNTRSNANRNKNMSMTWTQQKQHTQRRNSSETTGWLDKQSDLNTIILAELRDFKKNFKLEIREEQKALREEIKRDLQEETDALAKKIDGLSKDISKIEKEVEEVAIRTEELENRCDKLEDIQRREEQALLAQEKRRRDKAIKIRGVPEQLDENLEDRLIPVLAEYLSLPEQLVDIQIDKLFRVNSKIAKEKGLPRDITICFNNTQIKEKVIARNYNDPMIIDDVAVDIYKDLPFHVLKQRQQYKFLTAALQKNEINYRWSNTEGVIFTFQQKRFKINTTEKAKDFYRKFEQLQKESEERKRRNKKEESRGPSPLRRDILNQISEKERQDPILNTSETASDNEEEGEIHLIRTDPGGIKD